MTHPITPIGYISTPFSQKFSIPRQGVSLSPAMGTIVFSDMIDVVQATDGLEAFSHLWLIFTFSENISHGFKSKVRPPRLGGNKKVGVFASRSSFRPNGIGMSVVKNMGLKDKNLLVEGVDLLNNTPILDIKPYIPYADSIPNASAGFANEKPQNTLIVRYTDKARKQLNIFQNDYSDLPTLIQAVLEQDPRPSYKRNKTDTKIYTVRLYNLDISWHVEDIYVHIIQIIPVNEK